MTKSKADDVLRAWDSLADRLAPPVVENREAGGGWRLALGVALAAVLVISLTLVREQAGNASVGGRVPSLRTFPSWSGGACDAIGILDPVSGNLSGDARSREVAWLETESGEHLSIIWPEGFKAVFDPGVTLVDGHGSLVAHAGDRIRLQVEWGSAQGTFEDPYYAIGIMSVGSRSTCYPGSHSLAP